MNLELVPRHREERDAAARTMLGALSVVLRPIIEDVVEELLADRDEHRRWLTAVEAGELLGISAAAVGARVRKGSLPGRLYCRRIYVDREALDEAIEGSATLPSSAWGDPRATRRPRR